MSDVESKKLTWKDLVLWTLPAALAVGLFVATLKLVKPGVAMDRRTSS